MFKANKHLGVNKGVFGKYLNLLLEKVPFLKVVPLWNRLADFAKGLRKNI